MSKRLKNRKMQVIYRGSHCRPGIPWEEQVTKFKDLETGEKYAWWSDRVLWLEYDLGRVPQVGDIVMLSGTPQPGYGGKYHLRNVKIHSIEAANQVIAVNQ